MGAAVVYNAPSFGDEANLVPTSTSQLAKMVLYNTTRGNNALISNCNTGTNTITLTANVPANWVNGDTITIRSQTNTDTLSSAAYFVDFEFTGGLSAAATGFGFNLAFIDSVAGEIIRFHPYTTGTTCKRFGVTALLANYADGITIDLPLISSRFCVAWSASGANTVIWLARLLKEFI